MKFKPNSCREHITNWLDEAETPFWVSRYAALMALEPLLGDCAWVEKINNIREMSQDSHRFVRAKARKIISNYYSN